MSGAGRAARLTRGGSRESCSLGRRPNPAGDYKGALCGWSCSSSLGCSGSAGEDSGAASRLLAAGGAWEILGSLCGGDTQSQDKGWGQAAPPDIGSSAHSVPPVRRSSSCPRVPHREDSLKHLLVQAPRASPFCLCPRTSFHLNAFPPICPGALIPESKSWQDPESLVQPFQSTDGETAAQRGAGVVPAHRAGSCRALISIPGLGCQLLPCFVIPGPPAQKALQPPPPSRKCPCNSGLQLGQHLLSVPPPQ